MDALEGKGQHLAEAMATGTGLPSDSTRLSSPDINHRIQTTCSRHISNTRPTTTAPLPHFSKLGFPNNRQSGDHLPQLDSQQTNMPQPGTAQSSPTRRSSRSQTFKELTHSQQRERSRRRTSRPRSRPPTTANVSSYAGASTTSRRTTTAQDSASSA